MFLRNLDSTWIEKYDGFFRNMVKTEVHSTPSDLNFKFSTNQD